MTGSLNRPTRRQFGAIAGTSAAGAVLGGAALAVADSPAYSMPVNLSGLVAGAVRQVVLTVAPSYRNPRATVSGWARQLDDTWNLTHGPYASWIGVGGFAAPGRKRESDGHSPTGVFGMPLAFGVKARPHGLRLPFHPLHPPYEIWVENPRSRYYNELVDVRRVGARGIGDRESPVAYPLGAFIAYNPRRVPHLGSAIFLHPSHNSPTIGCVSIPLAQLDTLLTWLSPAAQPMMVMGVTAELLTMGGGVPLPVSTPTPIGPAPGDSAFPTDSPTDSPIPTDSPTPSDSPTAILPPLP